jgi:cell division transport system ATP-binding protein
MLSAYDKPSSGNIQVAGFDLGKITADQVALFRRRIGVVFQDFKLLKDRTIFENVALPLMVKGERPAVIQRRVADILDHVGLGSKAHQRPEFVSGGEQQRTAIARALIHQPGLLIADEPTGNLDPRLSEEIMDVLERVCAQGTTVFVATHDLEMVEKRKKRTLKIENGSIIGDTK